jgi:hypothetical protein
MARRTMAVLGPVLCCRLLAVFAFIAVVAIRLTANSQYTLAEPSRSYCTVKRLDGPAFAGGGRLRALCPPILREPSLVLDEVAWKGSGAATLESF